ncbi:MAG: hypothetical protein KIT22_02725, partial [Verrucomicrobiae bacterium]|nr:hypothetical protein [Verrucomicrobiae bacterium]
FAVRGLAEDAQGRLYAGAYHHGLWVRGSGGEWQRLTAASDRGSGEIWGIHADGEGTLWAATDSGLARWSQGAWHAYGTLRGELPRLVRSVVCDDQQGLWMASQFGVVRVDLSVLNDSPAAEKATLESDWFDRSDGLPSISCSDEQGALLKAADGRVWVGTLNGAAVADPLDWRGRRRRINSPSVEIEAVLVDDQSVAEPRGPRSPGAAAEASVPPGAQRVEFRYNAVDLTPNRRTRLYYRLEGLDQGWRDAGGQREAVYHHLAPGTYRFQVMAANKYGLRSAEAATAAVWVAPRYWQTLWFKVGAGCLGMGVLWWIRSLTLRQLNRERVRRETFSLGLLQSQEAERKRIARELHDSLGQDLILIRNAAKLTLRKFNPVPPISDNLSEMAELAAHALTNARAITSNLRPPELDRLGLTAALEAMVEKHATHSGIRLTATIENVNGLWSADQEIHVYRVVQESLNNALKHANPQYIGLSVNVQHREVSILLQDDGCGFEPEQPTGRGTGMGLAGLRERVRILNGTMELNSTRGEGTIFRCQIPISVYGKAQDDPNSDRG